VVAEGSFVVAEGSFGEKYLLFLIFREKYTFFSSKIVVVGVPVLNFVYFFFSKT
jgi:hypothetical protein